MNEAISTPVISQEPYMMQSDILELNNQERGAERKAYLAKKLVAGQLFYRPSIHSVKIEVFTYLGYFGGSFMAVKGKVNVGEKAEIVKGAFPVQYFVRDLILSEGDEYKLESYYLCEQRAIQALSDGLKEKAASLASIASDMAEKSLLERITGLLDSNHVEYELKESSSASEISKPPQNGYGSTKKMLAVVDSEYRLYKESESEPFMRTSSTDQAFMLLCS